MIRYFRTLLTLVFGISFLLTAQIIESSVSSIAGDTGSAQSGSLVISGGSSGATFDSTSSTITLNFDSISLPLTTSTSGQILFSGNPVLHNYGVSLANTFVGAGSGNFTLTGGSNTVCGASALNSLTSGGTNTGIGESALVNVTTGSDNTGVGISAGAGITSGSSNTLIGYNAGSAYQGTESNNIILGSSTGVLGESNVTRIGNGGGQLACFIEGIFGATVNATTALSVYVDNAGTLGTILSSAHLKSNIKPMGNQSAAILNLNPVSYTLKSDPKKHKQFGLIAQEVHQLLPELVILDKKGDPYGVRYHDLPVLLLNELQKNVKHIETLEKQVSDLIIRIQMLESRLSDLRS